jgi:ribosomal protein L36
MSTRIARRGKRIYVLCDKEPRHKQRQGLGRTMPPRYLHQRIFPSADAPCDRAQALTLQGVRNAVLRETRPARSSTRSGDKTRSTAFRLLTFSVRQTLSDRFGPRTGNEACSGAHVELCCFTCTRSLATLRHLHGNRQWDHQHIPRNQPYATCNGLAVCALLQGTIIRAPRL